MNVTKSLGLAPFDAADYLTTPELVMEYLNAVLAENDSAFLHEALETIAQAPAMAALAEKPRISRSDRDLTPPPDVDALVHLVMAMGLRLQVVAA